MVSMIPGNSKNLEYCIDLKTKSFGNIIITVLLDRNLVFDLEADGCSK